jgi:methionyl aminopeptidase
MQKGLVIAREPMVTLGTGDTEVLADGLTVVTAEGCTAAHWEHTVAILPDRGEVLTA